jgi:hypothetical protein
VRDDEELLKIAALLGVILALDEERSQRPPPVPQPRRSVNANLPNHPMSAGAEPSPPSGECN